MTCDLSVSAQERTYLRDLAKLYLEYANLPIMKERTAAWYAHNALVKGSRPMVVFETGPVLGELVKPLSCTSPLARQIEHCLQTPMTEFDLVGDDKVITPECPVNMHIHMREFDIDVEVRHAADAQGRKIGFATEYPMQDIVRDMPALRHSVYHADLAATNAVKDAYEGVLGDLMPVPIRNTSLTWHITASAKIVKLMGMEYMLLAMLDHPEELKELYSFIVQDVKQYLLWQEREGLLTPNNGNHYAGAGSYGFSNELSPQPRNVRLKDLWFNMNTQETVGISPAMFEEFVLPAYRELAELGGLVYFGCCEPVHDLWDRGLGELPNLRKVSISPWCNEEFIGERLRTAPVIYSRKPRPNFIGVGKLDEQLFGQHVAQTVQAAKGCHLEIIFRDIYSLDGDAGKPGRAVRIVREMFDRM